MKEDFPLKGTTVKLTIELEKEVADVLTKMPECDFFLSFVQYAAGDEEILPRNG